MEARWSAMQMPSAQSLRAYLRGRHAQNDAAAHGGAPDHRQQV